MNELIEKDPVYELIPKEDVEFLIKFDEYKKRAKVIEESIKAKAQEFLEKNNVDEFIQDGIRIYKTKPYTKKQVDLAALKEQGLYDEFLREIEVEGSIKVQVIYDD